MTTCSTGGNTADVVVGALAGGSWWGTAGEGQVIHGQVRGCPTGLALHLDIELTHPVWQHTVDLLLHNFPVYQNNKEVAKGQRCTAHKDYIRSSVT